MVKFEIRIFFSCFPTFTLLQKSSSQALRSEHCEAVGIWLADYESLWNPTIWLANIFGGGIEPVPLTLSSAVVAMLEPNFSS